MARLFDGASDRIVATASYTGNTFTLATWLYVNSPVAYEGIVESRSSGFQGLLFSGASGNPLTYDWENAADEYDGASGLTVSTGVWHFAGLRISPTAAVVHLDSASWTNTKTHNSQSPSVWNFGCDPQGPTRFLDGQLAEIGMWDATLTVDEMAALAKGFSPHCVRPGALFAYWPLIGRHSPEIELFGKQEGTLTGTAAIEHPRIIYPKPRRVIVPVTASGLSHTLTCATGSYALTGTEPALEQGYKVPLDVGSYALTGTEPTIRQTHILPVAVGAYTLTGTEPALEQGYKIDLDAGTYTSVGIEPTLRQTSILVCAAGAYNATGTEPALEQGYVVALAAGAYAVSGVEPALQQSYIVSFDVGAYTIAGVEPLLRKGRTLIPDLGSYALTGVGPTLRQTHILVCATGTYALTGTPPTLSTTSSSVELLVQLVWDSVVTMQVGWNSDTVRELGWDSDTTQQIGW